MERAVFEAAAVGGEILHTAEQPNLPPWLEALEGENPALRDSERLRGKVPHSERIDRRLLAIAAALDDLQKILMEKDISGALNRYARQVTPPQNESRFRLWFLTYLCFGRNYWSLLPPFHLAGNWDRKKLAPRKMGAPSKAHGKRYGYGMSRDMAERCDKAYVKCMGLGKSMKAIYEEAMRKEFRCVALKQPSGMMVYAHPESKPFPTLRQFRYQIGKTFGIERVQKNRYGSVRHRNRLAPSIGRYSSDVANLMEKVEADGYFTAERPKGYLEGSTLEPLCVVTCRDMLSGILLGIGFSFGSEQAVAYRMMLFCMAVPKDYFCQLWGLSIDKEEWPSQGLPPHIKVDRGPGSSLSLVEGQAKPVIREMTKSWSGQSKATIESSHPRDVRIEGQPTYVDSDYTPVDLCRREIMRTIKYNHTADMSARMEIDRELTFIPPTPIALFNHYDSMYRNSAYPISIDDSVRAFLTPVTFKAGNGGLFHKDLRFDSKSFRESGLLDSIARTGRRDEAVQGYMMDGCYRCAWVEVDCQLLTVYGQGNIRDDVEKLNVSLKEHEQRWAAKAEVHSAFRVHASAASTYYIESFESQTGVKWQETKRKYGRPKSGASSRQENIDVRQYTAKLR